MRAGCCAPAKWRSLQFMVRGDVFGGRCCLNQACREKWEAQHAVLVSCGTSTFTYFFPPAQKHTIACVHAQICAYGHACRHAHTNTHISRPTPPIPYTESHTYTDAELLTSLPANPHPHSCPGPHHPPLRKCEPDPPRAAARKSSSVDGVPRLPPP